MNCLTIASALITGTPFCSKTEDRGAEKAHYKLKGNRRSFDSLSLRGAQVSVAQDDTRGGRLGNCRAQM